MPHFDKLGREEWICQCCGNIKTSQSAWLNPVPGKTFAGNVCVSCMKKYEIIHDDICGVWRGNECNCPSFALKR